jgi:hypothetical protein
MRHVKIFLCSYAHLLLQFVCLGRLEYCVRMGRPKCLLFGIVLFSVGRSLEYGLSKYLRYSLFQNQFRFVTVYRDSTVESE